MRQVQLHLSSTDRKLIDAFRAKGLRHAREINRAHILAALDRGIAESQIMAVLGIGRTAIWRTRSAYHEGGVEYALRDVARPGKPRQPHQINHDLFARIVPCDMARQHAGIGCRWAGVEDRKSVV